MNWFALHALIETLGWTLVHFLWQGVVLGALFVVSRVLTGRAGSRLRYRLSLSIFLLTGLVPVLTFLHLWQGLGAPVEPLGGVSLVAGQGMASGAPPWWAVVEQLLRPWLPWLVAGWLAGVGLLSGRVCVDWWQVRRLTRRGVSPLTPEWQVRVQRLVADFGVRRPVRVLRSAVVRVPAVIGWLRPVILLPAAAFYGLSPRQLELVIAHELVHIRRADYLANLLQIVIETLLFYHPVVTWMSANLREDREHCCDDAVIGTCGDTLTYAHALTELEAQRGDGYQTALAASGGHLSRRIYRMLEHQAPRRGALIWSLSLVVGLAAASLAVATQVAVNNRQLVEPEPVTDGAPALATLTVPAAPSGGPGTGAPPAAATTPESAPALPDSPSAPERRRDAGRAAAQAPADGPAESGVTASQPPEATRQQTASATPTPEPEPPAATESVQPPAGAEPGSSSRPDATQSEAPATSSQPAGPPGDISDSDPELAPIELAAARRDDRTAARHPEPVTRGGSPMVAEAPRYPRRARVRGLEGSVTAVFTIDRQGRVRDVQIQDSSPAGVFDHAVKSALAAWRFEPLYVDGEAVSRRVSRVFEFTLAGGASQQRVDSPDSCDPVTGTRICRAWGAGDIPTDLQALRPD